MAKGWVIELTRTHRCLLPIASASYWLLPTPQPRDFVHVGANERAQVIVERRRHIVTGRVDEMVLHHPRLARDRLEWDQRIVDRIVGDAADRDRPVARATNRILHRLLADLARLALVDRADAADE